MSITPETVKTVHTCFENFFEAQKAPGLVYAITHNGSVVHSACFGAQRVAPHELMTSASISRIASMTKSFAAVAALKLRDAGLLDLNAPISSISRSLNLCEPLASASLSDLMAMKLDLVTDDPWADRLLGATNEEIDPHFSKPLLRAGLGSSRCAYSNLSYFLLGRIIAIVSGRPLIDYISREITSPLGMHDTVWNPPEQLSSRMAMGYRADSSPPADEERYTCRSDAAAFGGLWSTVSDLAVWLEFLRAGDGAPAEWESVLCTASRRQLSLPYASYDSRPFESAITGHPFDTSASYGFGVVRGTLAGMETLSHSGGIPGYGSHMRVEVRSGYGVVALGNCTYCPVWTPCADSLLHVVSSLGHGQIVDAGLVVAIGRRLSDYILSGAATAPHELFSYNFWPDNPAQSLATSLRAVLAQLGDGIHVTRITCRSGYQGEISFAGALSERKIVFQLAPHAPARIQHVAWM